MLFKKKYDRFAQLGLHIFRYRWFIISFISLLFLCCLPLAPKALHTFTATGFANPYSESAQAKTFLQKQLPYQTNQFIVLYQSQRPITSDTLNQIHTSLAGLKTFSLPVEIIYPSFNNKQIASNKKYAYAIVFIKQKTALSASQVQSLKKLIKKPAQLKLAIGGESILLQDTNQQTTVDLLTAEKIATPLATITLLLVFGSVTAALIPIILDGMCALFILSILCLIGAQLNLSVFTLNIALLLGLCLSLDYALFVIYRFRQELAAGKSVEKALQITQATAGRAVFYSGLAVLISLSALLFFPITVLISVGIGGMTAVIVAVLISVIVLPAVLAILGPRINFLPIKLFSATSNQGLWLKLVSKVVTYPWSHFIAVSVILCALGWPFFQMVSGISDYRIVPKHLTSRQVFDKFSQHFSAQALTPITVIVKSQSSAILTTPNLASLQQFTQALARDKRVKEVKSIVSIIPNTSAAQYANLYQTLNRLPPALQQYLKLSTGKQFTVIQITSKYHHSAKATQALITHIRHYPLAKDLKVMVTGEAANTMDVLATISQLFPYALLWIGILSYVILLILLRSIVLPLKAIAMNSLSLFASYGVLVSILQKGYLASYLNFSPQGMVDISLLVIIFCALFGFSMDYEVFLLTRIKEYYEQSKDNLRSICYGIAYSSKIITSAAIIVILICFSFISADILLVKAFGLGIAIAIFLDAFLIRTILVPATMAILKTGNWYLPKWLNRVLP